MDNTQAKQEFDATAEKYGGEDAYNLAKADGRTVLTYKQWVQVRTPSFKAWFGDWENDPENASKVIHLDTGEPKPVKHGTPNDFYAFSKEKIGSTTDTGWLGAGFYFYGNNEIYAQQYAKGGKILDVFLNIRNPYYASTDEMERLAEADSKEKSEAFTEQLQEDDYDGVSYNGDLNDEWVTFSPEQIKSATDNIGTFDGINPDIRFDLFGLPENDIATIENDLRIAKCLQGEPVAVLNDRVAPHTGMADIRKWANGVFNAWGNHAVNPELGEIVLDNKSVKNTLGHKISPFKVEAIRSIKEVIEQGVVVSSTQVRREEHFFISAPVTIENKEDIVTVLVKRNRDTQRMYLHSVMVKESILQKNFEQENAPEYIDRNADTEVSEPNPKLYSGDIGRILQKYLKVNISELEKELKIMENQQIEQQTTQPESVLQYIKMANHPFIDDEPYFKALTPEQQVFVRQYLDSMNNESEQNHTLSNNEIHPDEISWRDEIVYLSLRYEEIDGVSIYHDKGLMNRPLNQLSQVELEDRLNIAEYLLSEAMVRTQDRQVWNDLQKQVNEVQNEMEHRKQQEVQPAAANRYEQNAAKNPVFLEKIDNRHQPVMPFDDFVIAAMKDTGDSREEIIAVASEAFRSQYQAADGYLRAAHDSGTMYNAFDIEIDDKTYYATAPLEWVKEQARMGLSDRGYALEVARHNFLHSSLDEWETAFHQLKAAADDYKQWRNQVCAFFNFRQPEITLQQGEWTQVAQFVNYNQEWEQLDNARLLIAEFTPQQAFEFLGVYQQYQRYVSLAEHNAEQGIDTPELNTQIAALEQSLNEKVAQNLPQTENRQVLFDLFGTQLGLFDEETQPESEKQGVSASEKTTERLPENTAQGTTTPENSDRLPENAWKAVPKEKIKEERKDEYFTTPKVLERSNYWIVDNGVVVTLDQYRPMYNRHMTIKTFDTVEEAKQYAERFFELEQGISASENSQPANLSLWLEENGFDFESVDSHREVFQKDNLKLAVYNEDGDYFVSLSQFDKNIPITEIDEKMIEPTRQERIYFFQHTDDLEKLSQYLRAMEQGVSVSATPENGVETQPETVSDSPNSKFLGKEFTIDGDTFASATLIQIKSRKIDKQFTDLGYKTELEIHAIHGNLWTARNISEQDFQRLAGKKGYGLFYDTSKREFVAVGGKFGERRLFEIPASQFGKEFETLLTELRNIYNIDGSKIVNSQTESLSGSPTTQEQGISASEISETVAVSHNLSGQPETVVDNSQNTIEKLVDDYIRATAHNSRLENYQAIMRNYFLQKIDGNNPFFENRPDKMVRAEWLLSLAQNPKNFITIKNREMPELKVVIIDNQKVDIAPDEIRFFNYLREQQRIGLAEKTPVADKSIKELKAELKAAKDALTAAKKELKGLRDEFDSKRGYSYFNTSVAEVQIIHKQQEVLNWQNQFDNLTLQLKTQTGEITDLEREILTARLSGNIDARVDIVRRELKTQKDELRQQYDEMGERIKKGEVYEFEIQSVMQEAVDYYSGIRGIGTIYHNNKPLPLNTDREKAIAYLLKQELPRQQFEQFGKPHNRIIHQLNNRLRVRWGINFTTRLVSLQTKYLDAIESAENQLMKGSIEDRAEINLTYDINTPDGEQKVRELFYGSRHDEAQAELFERVFAMAQKLGVEVRHALRDSGENKEINKFVLGQYSLAKNSARVKHNGYIKPEQKGEVLLHELVHSVTSRAMLLKEQGHTELLNPAQVKAIDEIERIYQAVIAKAEELGFEKYQEKGGIGIGGDYGLKNSHEFIAELSNPKFREKLKQVAMFDDTVKAMTEVATGVEKTETAYDRLTAALYQIMDNYEPDFGARYEQAKYGNIKMNDIFIEPEQQENTMKISNLYKDEDGFAVNMREFNDGDYDYSVFYRDTFLKSFRSPEYAIQAIHQNKTALFEEYHRMTYRPSHTENGVTYFTGGFTYLNADRLPEKENQMEQTIQAAEKSGFSSPENSVKHDMNGLSENYQVRAADFDDFNPNLDGKTITANTLYSDIYTDIKPEQQGKTVGEVLRTDENALWDAEFWGELVGHGTVKVSDDLVAQVIETQRSEVLQEILTCGNVPFTKEHIEALYQREPELIKEVADEYDTPKIKALAKEVVETAEIGLKKQAFNNMFALLQVSDKISALEKRLQKQPNASAVQTELKELKHEQVKLEEEYDKITDRAFDAGIPLKEIRNGAKRQHAEFSGKPITSMQQLVDKLDKAYPINKGEPFVKLDFFDDSKENERSNATLSITATELFFREVDKYDKRHTIDEYAFFDVKIVDNDGKDLKNGSYGIYKTEDIIENHSGLFGFLLNKNSFSPNPQQEKADENLALALSDYLDDKVKNELPAYLEEIADYKALPSVTGVVSLASKKEAQAIRAFNERLQEHLQNKEVKRDAFGLPETATTHLKEQAKQSPQSPQASTKDDELLKQLCKPDFALRKAALNDPEISVNLLKRVIDNHKCPQTRNAAKAVLEQRQGGGVGVSQPQSNTRSIAGATPKAAAPKPKASMSM